ncbi:Hypothetical predicted protein [Pelobates cultripes]|uniref:Uncharacterized protein n=1 Tax=Pelobates cultripes TaxID=61616 RepID=A0AAD1QXS3_PELCU|nr:Hypothetical predicted protein [Pelobates cultripes]
MDATLPSSCKVLLKLAKLGRKTHHRAGAYHTPSGPQAASYLSVLHLEEAGLYPYSASEQLHGSVSMGRKSQKPHADASRYSQYKGVLLQRPAAYKMAALPEHDASSSSSESVFRDHVEPANGRQPPLSRLNPDLLTPATKLDIKNLLMELKQMSAADMNLIRKEVQSVTTGVQASEEDISDVQR